MMTSSLPEEHRKIALRILFCPAEERTARELQGLPRAEREQLWADMTGNPENTRFRMTAEGPEFLYDRIQALHHALDATAPSHKIALLEAVQRDSAYVDLQKIKFLRADNFEATAAAVRLVKYFEAKKDLFGLDKIARDIRLGDLGEDDMQSLMAGGMQMLASKDHAGRRVMFSRHHNYVYKEHSNMLRAFFYMAQHAIEDEQSQQVGCVSVSYQVGAYPKTGYDFELTRKVSSLVRAFPIRFVAIYLCYSASPWQRVADLISHLLSPILRVRLRSVQGSHQECVYKLMLLGIPHDCFPITAEGESDLSSHQEWIKQRWRAENPGQTT